MPDLLKDKRSELVKKLMERRPGRPPAAPEKKKSHAEAKLDDLKLSIEAANKGISRQELIKRQEEEIKRKRDKLPFRNTRGD